MRNPVGKRSLIALGAASIGLGLLTGCGGSAGPADTTLVSDPPKGVAVDAAPTGSSIGDLLVFNATVRRDGAAVGHLYGTKMLVARPGRDGASAGFGVHQNQLTFVLDDGTIAVAGVQDYPVEIDSGTKPPPAERPIVGGTGAYAGASGVLNTTDNPDGTKTQVFDFTD